MAEEAGHFDFGDVVARDLRQDDPPPSARVRRDARKLADVEAQTAAWEAHQGRRARSAKGDADTSALAGISRGMPEWQRALKLQQRAARVGFDWPNVDPVFDKLHEELDEVRAEFADGADPERLDDEIGDVLFVCVNLARHAKVDVSRALRHANAKFERRFRRMEALAAAEGTRLAGKALAEQDALWDRAKAEEKAGRLKP